ncbi:arsenate reductase [Acinetobacter haemolyticus]|nr:arsenate reductase [Acinetobacter haemolyticus]
MVQLKRWLLHKYLKIRTTLSFVYLCNKALEIWLKEIGADKVLNKKGTTWRKLTADEQAHASSSEQNLIETLIAQPSLIKRPVLQTPQGFIIGFDETTYQNLSA